MGFTEQNLLSDALAKGHIGQMNISLDSWTDVAIPSITEGSWLQAAGTIYYLSGGDLTIDGDSALSLGAVSTLFYYHFDVVDKDVICTTSQPSWQDDKSEWGQTLGGHYARCLGSVFKDGSGNITQKAIWYSREYGILASGLTIALLANADRTIRLSTDCRILWDESEDEINIDKDVNLTANLYHGDFDYGTNNGLLLAEKTVSGSLEFYVKKPISAIFSYYSQSAGYTLTFDVYYNSGWTTIKTYTGASGNEYIALNPGRFRFTLQNSYAGNYARLYGVGVFSQDTVEVAEIIA